MAFYRFIILCHCSDLAIPLKLEIIRNLQEMPPVCLFLSTKSLIHTIFSKKT